MKTIFMQRIFIVLFCLFLSANTFAQGYKIENNELITEKQVLFKAGTAELLPESEEVLNYVKKYLEDKSYISLLRVEGNVSGSANDQKLSEQRALAVCKWLVTHGVDCKRLIPVAFGSTKPIVDNSTPEGKAQNTHISFVNAALRGHAIGGMPVDGSGKVAGDPCQ